MKSIRIPLALMAFAFSLVFFGQVGYAQTETPQLNDKLKLECNKDVSTGPKVVVKVKSQGEINPLFAQIDDLTGGDEILSEQVIFEIFRNRSTKLVGVVSEKEYFKLSDAEKSETILDSEVIEIIENIKSR